MLSNTCKYAVRAVIYLASKYDSSLRYGIQSISSELDLPAPFLGKILQKLAKNGVLCSNKGPNGGFSLGKRPEEISLYSIVKIIDGEEIFETCVISKETCAGKEEKGQVCALHEGYSSIREQMKFLFKEQMISDLLSEHESEKRNLKF